MTLFFLNQRLGRIHAAADTGFKGEGFGFGRVRGIKSMSNTISSFTSDGSSTPEAVFWSQRANHF